MILLTEQELCEVLKVRRVYLYHCRQKGMPYIMLGTKLIRYDLEEVLVWFKEGREFGIEKNA